jgi:hypothetical protein
VARACQPDTRLADRTCVHPDFCGQDYSAGVDSLADTAAQHAALNALLTDPALRPCAPPPSRAAAWQNPYLTRLAEGDSDLGLDSLAPREFEHLNRDVRRTFNQVCARAPRRVSWLVCADGWLAGWLAGLPAHSLAGSRG